MSVADRRKREKTELRQEILDAARRIFREEGFDALTMRRVANAIEYSPTTIYLYFKNKADLVQAICDELFTVLGRRLQDFAGKHTDPLEYLEAGLRAYIEVGLKHPSHYYVAFVAAAGRVDYRYEGSSGQKAFEMPAGHGRRVCAGGPDPQGRPRCDGPGAVGGGAWPRRAAHHRQVLSVRRPAAADRSAGRDPDAGLAVVSAFFCRVNLTVLSDVLPLIDGRRTGLAAVVNREESSASHEQA